MRNYVRSKERENFWLECAQTTHGCQRTATFRRRAQDRKRRIIISTISKYGSAQATRPNPKRWPIVCIMCRTYRQLLRNENVVFGNKRDVTSPLLSTVTRICNVLIFSNISSFFFPPKHFSVPKRINKIVGFDSEKWARSWASNKIPIKVLGIRWTQLLLTAVVGDTSKTHMVAISVTLSLLSPMVLMDRSTARDKDWLKFLKLYSLNHNQHY